MRDEISSRLERERKREKVREKEKEKEREREREREGERDYFQKIKSDSKPYNAETKTRNEKHIKLLL